MTPQELINLPYAGMAKTQLIAEGMWRVTANDWERLDWLDEHKVTIQGQEGDKYLVRNVVGEWTGEGIRGHIDHAAATEFMEDYA